ncbi:MAG: GIY-YIG nuclease family protein [Pseudomonadota bacterium]
MVAVYMVCNRRNGVIYIGVTSDLIDRIWHHRQGTYGGFTRKWGCKRLVYFEEFELISDAIHREKCLKSYRRKNKINLIENENPDWLDLWFKLVT